MAGVHIFTTVIGVTTSIAFWACAFYALYRGLRWLYYRCTEPPETAPPEDPPQPYMSPVEKREYHDNDWS